MKKRTFWIATALGLALLSGQPASANWVHFSDSIFDALGQTVKHPRKLRRVIVLPTDATGSAESKLARTVEVCIGYVNNFDSEDRGKVTAIVTISNDQGIIEVVELGGGVRRGAFGQCRPVSPLAAGDILDFDFTLKKFPRLRDDDRFQVAAAVAIDGANPFARQAGPLSLADQEGIAKMAEWVEAGRGAALRRESSGWTVDWRIDGVAFELGRTFRTIAAAIEAWCDRI